MMVMSFFQFNLKKKNTNQKISKINIDDNKKNKQNSYKILILTASATITTNKHSNQNEENVFGKNFFSSEKFFCFVAFFELKIKKFFHLFQFIISEIYGWEKKISMWEQKN